MDTMVPLNELTNAVIKYIEPLGSQSKTVSDVINNNDKVVHNLIEQGNKQLKMKFCQLELFNFIEPQKKIGIKKANEKSVSRAAKVQKFIILPIDFSLANDELGPSLKLRRPIVLKKYSSDIEKIYAE
jgi:long-chain-fatty-acid--CoA ligase ACSBG